MASDRMVLRAELSHESGHIIAHTTALSATSAFVRTDERLELGTRVTLTLSFPRLLAPVEIQARVTARDAGSGHGYWPGFELDFGQEHDVLARLLAPPESADPTDAYRVLLVEDSPTMRDIIEHNASRFAPGFKIDIVSTDSAESALAIIDASTFDLAIIDMYLSGKLTGADFVRDVRARNVDLPVMGFSIGGADARRQLVGAGADLYLDKPVMLRDVFATLERLVRAARSG